MSESPYRVLFMGFVSLAESASKEALTVKLICLQLTQTKMRGELTITSKSWKSIAPFYVVLIGKYCERR